MNVFLDENLPLKLPPALQHKGLHIFQINALMGNVPSISDGECMAFIHKHFPGGRNIFLTCDRSLTRRLQEIAEWRQRGICVVVLSGKFPNMRASELIEILSGFWPAIVKQLSAAPDIRLILVNERGIKKVR